MVAVDDGFASVRERWDVVLMRRKVDDAAAAGAGTPLDTDGSLSDRFLARPRLEPDIALDCTCWSASWVLGRDSGSREDALARLAAQSLSPPSGARSAARGRPLEG